METTLFGKNIPLKSYVCALNGQEPQPIGVPYVNLYIQLKGCNAKCKFCTFQEAAKDFNFKKFKEVLSELKKNIQVRKISVTGGEPTLFLDRLYKISDNVRKVFPDSFFVVNTNGYQLLDLYKDGKFRDFDSISLSRHHYDDKINNEILGFNSISKKWLEAIQHSWWQQKDKLHLSCNLINGYIDSPQKVYNYLEFAGKVKINDVGFVSLMKINYFCENNFVDFSDLKLKHKRLFKTKEWKFMDSCKCNNYLYIPNDINSDVVKVYYRCFMMRSEVCNSLVFDGENLKIGFDGLTLI